MTELSLVSRVEAAGFTLTPVRKTICAYLDKTHGVFSVRDILEAYPTFDKVTVYRTIELLKELDIIHPSIHLDEEQLFEVHEEKKHHHHVICTSCRKNVCVMCVIPQKKVPGFSSLHHEVAYTGLCAECLKKRS